LRRRKNGIATNLGEERACPLKTPPERRAEEIAGTSAAKTATGSRALKGVAASHSGGKAKSNDLKGQSTIPTGKTATSGGTLLAQLTADAHDAALLEATASLQLAAVPRARSLIQDCQPRVARMSAESAV
jgi:hypothetical protein